MPIFNLDFPDIEVIEFSLSDLAVDEVVVKIRSDVFYDDIFLRCKFEERRRRSPFPPFPFPIQDDVQQSVEWYCKQFAREQAQPFTLLRPKIVSKKEVFNFPNCTNSVKSDEILRFDREVSFGLKLTNETTVKLSEQIKRSVGIGFKAQFAKTFEINGRTDYEVSKTREINYSTTEVNDWTDKKMLFLEKKFTLEPQTGVRITVTWREATIPVDVISYITFKV
ncbi:hypothetical protein LC612_43135 [Nostoc sp. CHAB 5834]|nr:hypothetical protein [Nostoc sp. CHAB 5834]